VASKSIEQRLDIMEEKQRLLEEGCIFALREVSAVLAGPQKTRFDNKLRPIVGRLTEIKRENEGWTDNN
jgi:hypothetical protein